MAENSKIEWTDATFNPWIGCTKISAACDHCYAEVSTPTRTLRAAGSETWGPHAERKRTSAANWKKPLQWDKKAEAEGKRYRVFCASLADVFDNHKSILPEWRADLWALIKETPHLDWLLLTKRPQNIAKMLPEDWGYGYENVWLGTTVEDQTEAARRIPHLLKIPAKVRFLSVEPMLGPVDLERVWMDCIDHAFGTSADLRGLDWVICGGESGPKARPMRPEWARSLRDQCQAAGVAFHFKQWGEWGPNWDNDDSGNKIEGTEWIDRMGKKTAGRVIDGRTWDEVPE